MNICNFNQHRLRADGTQNTATSPMLQRWWQFLTNSLIKLNMQWIFKRHFIIAILLNVNLLFISCHDKLGNTNQISDSLKTIKSTGLKQSFDTVLLKQGQTLFKTNCNSCHAIFKTDNYLQGVVQRVGENYLKLYLTRQDSLIKAKNNYALEVKKAFGNLGNSHNFHFSDEQLNAIILYLKKYSS